MTRKKKTESYEASTKWIIRHWNQSPGVQEIKTPTRNKPTKIYTKVTGTILPNLLNDNFTISKINKSITVYSKMLDDGYNYSLQPEMPGHRVDFAQFLSGFDSYTKMRIYPKNVVKKTTVWLKECLKSQDYLDETYGKYLKDSNPKVTKEFKEMFLNPWTKTTNGNIMYPHQPDWPELFFEEHQRCIEQGLSINEENMFRMATKRLLDFIKVYKIGKKGCLIRVPSDPVGLVVTVYRAISASVNYNHKISLTWLLSTKTYEERLPNLFKNSGEMKKFTSLEMPWKDINEKHGV
jgi:hypothetical protein